MLLREVFTSTANRLAPIQWDVLVGVAAATFDLTWEEDRAVLGKDFKVRLVLSVSIKVCMIIVSSSDLFNKL